MANLADLAPKPHVVVRAAIEAMLANPGWHFLERKKQLDHACHLLRGSGMGALKVRHVRKRIQASAKTLAGRTDSLQRDLDLAVDLALQD